MGVNMVENNLPKYLKIKEDLIQQITAGEFSTFDLLPTEAELCGRYDASRVTIRKALDELKQEDYVFSKAGFGTKINHRRDDLSLFTQVESFTSEMKEYGKKATTLKASLTISYADENLSKELKCPIGTKLFNLRRVRGNEIGPIVYSDTWLHLPYDLPSTHEFLYGSLYEFLISKGTYFARFEETLSAGKSTSDIAALLNQGDEGIYLKRIRRGYNSKDELIEITYNFYNPNLYSYEVEVKSIQKI